MKRRCPDFVRYVFRDYRLLVTFIVRDYGMSGVASRYYSSTVKPSMTRRSEARDHLGTELVLGKRRSRMPSRTILTTAFGIRSAPSKIHEV
jgi:hypothetical protein